MQPLAPLSVHNTAFQPFFTQQRCHRFQRRHTTNQQRCHWLQIPPADCQIGKTVGLSPSTHATAGTTVGPAPSTHATTGTTVGPQHRMSAIFHSTEVSPVSETAHNQPTEVSLVADPACRPPKWQDIRIHTSLGGKSPSNTNYTKCPGQQPHKQTVNNLRTGPR